MKPGSLSVKEDDKCVIIFQFAAMGFETKRIKRWFDPEYWYLNGYFDQFVVPCPAFVKPHLRNPHIKYHLTTIFIFTRHFRPYAYIFKSLVTIFRNCTKNNNNAFMMTSSNVNIFRVTGPLCGEFTSPGEFPTHRPVTRSFNVFFDLRLNKRLSKQPWGWWFETPSWSLWRHCNVLINHWIKLIQLW